MLEYRRRDLRDQNSVLDHLLHARNIGSASLNKYSWLLSLATLPLMCLNSGSPSGLWKLKITRKQVPWRPRSLQDSTTTARQLRRSSFPPSLFSIKSHHG